MSHWRSSSVRLPPPLKLRLADRRTELPQRCRLHTPYAHECRNPLMRLRAPASRIHGFPQQIARFFPHRACRPFGTPLAVTNGVSTRHPDLSRTAAPARAFSSQGPATSCTPQALITFPYNASLSSTPPLPLRERSGQGPIFLYRCDSARRIVGARMSASLFKE